MPNRLLDEPDHEDEEPVMYEGNGRRPFFLRPRERMSGIGLCAAAPFAVCIGIWMLFVLGLVVFAHQFRSEETAADEGASS